MGLSRLCRGLRYNRGMNNEPPPAKLSEDSAVPRPAIEAMLPPAMLHEDEIVLILAKPSLWFIPMTSIRFMLIVTGVAAILVRTSLLMDALRMTPQNMAIIAMLVCLGRLVWALLVWTSHVYLLTNQRIVTIKGVVNVVVFQSNLRKIQRTTLYKPLVLRFFGLGNIGIATAATTTFDSVWEMLPRPVTTHEQLVAAINRVQ
jgi:hypothetical protein